MRKIAIFFIIQYPWCRADESQTYLLLDLWIPLPGHISKCSICCWKLFSDLCSHSCYLIAMRNSCYYASMRHILVFEIKKRLVLSFCIRYGDKAPKSVAARVFSVVWILVGIINIALITANITSTLTALALHMEPSSLDNLKVGQLLSIRKICTEIFFSEEYNK